MRAGKLRHRVTIEQQVAGSPNQFDTGEPDEAWATFATVWASVRPLSGRELFLAQQAESRVEAEIEIRWITGVTAGMRVSASGVYYNIEAIINPEARDDRLILRCSTGLNAGQS